MNVSITQLKNILQITPVIIKPNPFLKLKLSNGCNIYSSLRDFKLACNRLSLLELLPTVVFEDIDNKTNNEISTMQLPYINCTYDPFSDDEFDFIIYRQFEEICRLQEIAKQSEIPDYIIKWVNEVNPQIVILLIIDGLSYLEVRNKIDAIPCFVDGLTLTEDGMKRIIGKPTVANRLFHLGYKNRIGFSYWDRKNDLTDILFSTFTNDRLFKVKSYDEVIEYISTNNPNEKSYIQIVRAGLDNYSHDHRDKLPINDFTDILLDEIKRLITLLQLMRTTFLFVMTSDHGILWNTDIGNDCKCLNINKGPSRYLKGDILQIPPELYPLGHYLEKEQVFMLSKKCICRKLSNLEWGYHGGISIQESFIPIVKISTN